jgi:hypothetical protein
MDFAGRYADNYIQNEAIEGWILHALILSNTLSTSFNRSCRNESEAGIWSSLRPSRMSGTLAGVSLSSS